MFRETLLILAIVFLIGAIAFFGFKKEPFQPASVIKPVLEIEPVPEIVLYAVGDIMMDRGVEYMIEKYGEGDFKFPFLNIASYLQEADIVFANLEGPISERGKRVGSIYSFRMQPESADSLDWAGFNVISLANNHMFDYQSVALQDTMTAFKERGITYIGAGFNRDDAFSLKIREVAGTRIGFLGYTNMGPVGWRASSKRPGMAWIDQNTLPNVLDYISQAKAQVDVLVVSLHAGVEYAPEPNYFQTSFSQQAIEAGADLVLGHHPHVAQKQEKYQDGWVAYSLGNFVFDQGFSEETMQSMLLKVVIVNKKIKQVIPQTIKMNQYFQPEIFE